MSASFALSLTQACASESPHGGCKISTQPCPVVTAQALRGVRLRSVKKQGSLLSDVLQANVSAPHLPNTSSKDPNRTRVITDEVSVGKAAPYVPVDKLKQNLDCGLEKQTKYRELKPQTFKCDATVIPLNSLGFVEGSNLTNRETLHEIKYNQIETQNSNAYIALANVPCSGPWLKIPCGTVESRSDIKKLSLPQEITDNILLENKLTEQAVSPGDSEKPWQTDSSYWTLSGTKSKPNRGNRASENDGKSSEYYELKGYSDSKQSIMVPKIISPKKIPSLEKPDSLKKVCSAEKPSLPKKPDLGVLGLTSTITSREGPVQGNTRQMAKCFSDLCQSQPDETGLADGSYSPQNLNFESLLVNGSDAADVTPPLSASSPKKQKPPILHKKPEVTSPLKSKSSKSFSPSQVYSTTGAPINCTSMDTSQAEKTFGVQVGTMEKCRSSCPLEPQGTSRHCQPNVIMGAQHLWSIMEAQSSAGNQTTSENPGIMGNLGNGSLQWDDGTTNQNRLIRPSRMNVHEEKEEEHTCGSTGTQILMMSSPTKRKESKRRKRSCRQLLMMSKTMEPTPSSSSSSSSSSSASEDEGDEVKTRLVKMRAAIRQARYEDTSDSESSGAPPNQSKYSLSSALSSDSLQAELSLPDLLIQEGDEDGSQEVRQERHQEVQQDGNLAFIHFLYPFVLGLRVTGVCWNLSQPSLGKGRIHPGWLASHRAIISIFF